MLKGHREWVTALCCSADQRYVMSGGADRTLRLWETMSGRCVLMCEGHSKAVTSVSLTFDGRFALSGSLDGTVKVWELATGRCLRTLQGHVGPVHSVCVGEDGRCAVSGGEDGTVRVWDLDWDLENAAVAQWDERARPYLSSFLSKHTPCSGTLSAKHAPTQVEVTAALTRCGKPGWGDEDFAQLLRSLACAGFGWLCPDGVRGQLEQMRRAWEGPPMLTGEQSAPHAPADNGAEPQSGLRLGYFEFPVPDGDAYCSERSCGCGESGTVIPRGTGYLYVSQEATEFRSPCRRWEEFREKMEQLERRGMSTALVSREKTAPVLMCEQGARKRKLNLDVAAADAKRWWETGEVPLRPTPRQERRIASGMPTLSGIVPRKRPWWRFWG